MRGPLGSPQNREREERQHESVPSPDTTRAVHPNLSERHGEKKKGRAPSKNRPARPKTTPGRAITKIGPRARARTAPHKNHGTQDSHVVPHHGTD